jgi:large subunit ribosomal protein L30
MARIRITQVKSRIGQPERQKRILDALGLKKMHQTVEHDDSPTVMGMVRKLEHLVRMEKI